MMLHVVQLVVFDLGGPEATMLLFHAEERIIKQGRGEYGSSHHWTFPGTRAAFEARPRMQGYAHHDAEGNQYAGEEGSDNEYKHHGGVFPFLSLMFAFIRIFSLSPIRRFAAAKINSLYTSF
jgi:hypothetical protein